MTWYFIHRGVQFVFATHLFTLFVGRLILICLQKYGGMTNDNAARVRVGLVGGVYRRWWLPDNMCLAPLLATCRQVLYLLLASCLCTM